MNIYNTRFFSSCLFSFFSIYPNFYLHFSIHTMAKILKIRLFNMYQIRVYVCFARLSYSHRIFKLIHLLLAYALSFSMNTHKNRVQYSSLSDEFCRMKINRKSFSECLLIFFLLLSPSPLFVIYFFPINERLCNEISNFSLLSSRFFLPCVHYNHEFDWKKNLRMNLTYYYEWEKACDAKHLTKYLAITSFCSEWNWSLVVFPAVIYINIYFHYMCKYVCVCVRVCCVYTVHVFIYMATLFEPKITILEISVDIILSTSG